jgi:hypothetical protein
MQKRLQSDSALSHTVTTGFGWHHLTLSLHQIPKAGLFLGAARALPKGEKCRPRAHLSLNAPCTFCWRMK